MMTIIVKQKWKKKNNSFYSTNIGFTEGMDKLSQPYTNLGNMVFKVEVYNNNNNK